MRVKFFFKIVLLFFLLLSGFISAQISVNDIIVRDPFIFSDRKTGFYYLPTSVGNNKNIKVFRSRDLLTWEDRGNCYERQPEFWGDRDFWAPDLCYFNNKYYLFVTFSNSANGIRGTSILESNFPEGPFIPLNNLEPSTEPTWKCLDATLYVDDDQKPWLIFCREWLEVIDGEIYAQQLSADLRSKVGNPIKLFSATNAPWVGGISSGNTKGYVTDAPFVFKNKVGDLLMLWSSFNKLWKYSIGVARSQSGTILGPWVQDSLPLNDDNGGHAMIFNSFQNVPMISYHSPNEGDTRIVMHELNDKLVGVRKEDMLISEEFNTIRLPGKLGVFSVKNFDPDLSSWVYSTSSDSILSGKYSAKFLIQRSSPNWWALQCRAENLMMEKDKTYKISFDIRGDRPFKSLFKIESVMDYSKIIDVNVGKQNLHYEFISPPADRSGSDGVVLFGFGNISAPNTIYLDNVIVEEVKATDIENLIISSSISLRNNCLCIDWQNKPTRLTVEVFDVMGRLLYTRSEFVVKYSEIILPKYNYFHIITIKDVENRVIYSNKFVN